MFDYIIDLAVSYIKAGCPCLFHMVTGFYCPGCGGTRSVISLFHGHFIQSFIYHPLVLFTILSLLYLAAKRFLPSAKKSYTPALASRLAIAALVLVILNFLIKNIFLLMGTDLLSIAEKIQA